MMVGASAKQNCKEKEVEVASTQRKKLSIIITEYNALSVSNLLVENWMSYEYRQRREKG